MNRTRPALSRLPQLCAPSALTLALLAACVLPAQAQSLTELYQSARAYDASYQSARSSYDGNVAKAEQAKAGLYPTIGLALGATRTQFDAWPIVPPALVNRYYTTKTAGVNAVQPLYRPSNLASYEQGKRQVELAQVVLDAAEQDLLVRVSQAYFDVLASQDSLAFVSAQKAAVAEQLASAKRNFEVGTSTITDTREAQARYDLVIAQEIAADNDLRVKKIALDQLVGITGTSPKPLVVKAALPELPADEVAKWVDASELGHPSIRQAQLNLQVAKLETEKAEAGHKPTLDLNAGYNVSRNVSGTSNSTVDSKVSLGTVGIAFNLPLFAGFATQNRIKETLALEDKARNDLEGAKRAVAQATRTAYFGVVSGLGQVKALEAAEASSQSALDANKLGYTVGVRINIDVLNSQSQLFQTKRDLAKARYDVLVGGLKLRQANGTLKADDLNAANGLLVK